jgi:hypothetical protein
MQVLEVHLVFINHYESRKSGAWLDERLLPRYGRINSGAHYLAGGRNDFL